MPMKKAVVFAAAALCAAVSAKPDAYDIGEDLAKSTENWEQSADDFAVEHGKDGFTFADNRRRDTVVGRKDGAVVFFGTPVMESRVYFKNRNISGVEL